MDHLTDVGELDRTQYLGGSDAANILGFGFKTPLETYLEKIGQGEEITEEKQAFFDRRKRNEPRVLEELVLERKLKIVRTGARYRHPSNDFMAAEIDFEFLVDDNALQYCPGIPEDLLGTIQNGEIKTVHPFAAGQFGEEGTDDIPISYCSQSMYGLAITNRNICLYGVMVGLDNLSTYVLHRDDEVIRGMGIKLFSFWNENVLKRVPPDPINNDDLKILFANKNGRPVELDSETLAQLERLRYLRSMKSSCEKEEGELKFQIGFYIAKAWGINSADNAEDNAVLTHNGAEVGKWRKQATSRLDGKALESAHPDIAKKFKKNSYFRVLK
jgi:predicted phage-related endonuclease